MLYYFLNWQHPKALLILVSLLSAIGMFYLIGAAITETGLRSTPWGPPLVLVATGSIMLVRDPRPDLA